MKLIRRHIAIIAVTLTALLSSYASANNAAHSGDRLIKADDAAAALLYTGASDFTDGADTATEYAYDPDGRLKSDANRGITSIDYNLICRPQEIIFSDESKMQMTYTASGELLQRAELEKFGLTTPAFPPRPSFRLKEYVTRRTITHYGQLTKDGGFYPRIETGYGYIRGDSTFYYIADYQGNNRQVVLGADASVVQENHYYPYGGLFGESSAAALLHINGTTANAYKYGGKEHLTMAGINMLDYHARLSDPWTCRFITPDALRERHFNESSYIFTGNNPINFVDRFGLDYRVVVTDDAIIISARIFTDTYSYSCATYSADIINSQTKFSLKFNDSNGQAIILPIIFKIDVEEVEVDLEVDLDSKYNLNRRRGALNTKITKYKSDGGTDGNAFLVIGDNLTSNELGQYTNGSAAKDLAYVRKSREDTETGAHEIGHLIGMLHEINGLMTAASNSLLRTKDLTPKDVYRSLKRAFNDEKNNSQDDSCIGKLINESTKYPKTDVDKFFEKFKVIKNR